jgi:hypothetical protein
MDKARKIEVLLRLLELSTGLLSFVEQKQIASQLFELLEVGKNE